MPNYQVSHRTTYSYASPVIESHHLLYLSPRETAWQQVSGHGVLIEPAPTARTERVDYFGNRVIHLRLASEHKEFTATAKSTVAVQAVAAINYDATTPWEVIAERRIGPEQGLDLGILDFAAASPLAAPSDAIRAFAQETVPAGAPILAAADSVMKRIFSEFSFDPATTDVSTPVDKALEQRSGVCQDFAHIGIATLRALNLPARYVSGYIRTLPPEGQERLVGADASHAWFSVWAPETGWVDFDPTNNIVNSTDHITVAYGRDFDDVSPISGVLLGGGDHTLNVAVDVEEVKQTPA